MEYRTRPATADDLPRLLGLLAQLNPDDPALPAEAAQEAWEQLARHPGMTVFVAEQGETLSATCTLIVTPNLTRGGRPFALIENVVTDAAQRRQGHGQAVLQAAIHAAWAAGCYKVMLMTGSKSPGTHRFYAEAGFEQSKTGYQIRRPTA